MEIDRSIRSLGVMLVLTVVLVGCEAPKSVSPPSPPAVMQAPDVNDDLRLAALASADSDQVIDAQLEYLTSKSIADVSQLDRDGSLRIAGFSHAFRYKSQVQVGVFDLPDGVSGPVALAEYKKSTGEFLRGMIHSTGLALREETDPARRRSYIELLDAFKLRQNAFDRGSPGIYSLRVRARAGFLAGLRKKDKTVRAIGLSDARQGRFTPPSLPTDVTARFEEICPLSVNPGRAAQSRGDASIFRLPLPDNCEPPPDEGDPATPPPSNQGAPSWDTGVSPNLPVYISDPISDPYTDDSYWDDNTVNNTYWAPSEGKSYIDFDQYSKYTMQHWLWKFPHLNLFRVAGQTGKFTIEGELHQDARGGKLIFANGFYTPRGPTDRGEVWESNFPAAYLDTRFLDRGDVPNHTVGTAAPERLQYLTFYYTWIRFSHYGGATSGRAQIAAQLGDRDGFCLSPNGWCSLTSLSTVRVLPWICGYRAPNRISMASKWKRWYYDGNGYKNEQCRDTP